MYATQSSSRRSCSTCNNPFWPSNRLCDTCTAIRKTLCERCGEGSGLIGDSTLCVECFAFDHSSERNATGKPCEHTLTLFTVDKMTRTRGEPYARACPLPGNNGLRDHTGAVTFFCRVHQSEGSDRIREQQDKIMLTRPSSNTPQNDQP
jgi:hypothetical protein